MVNQLLLECLSLTGGTYVLGHLIMRLAHRKGWVTRSSFRRKRGIDVALLGGLAIYIPLSLVALISQPGLIPFIVASVPIVAAGCLDDVIELKAVAKFGAQLISLILWMILIPADDLLLARWGVPGLLAQIISALWMLGLINATNMIDGMDGVAGSFAIVSALGVAMIAGTSAEMQLTLPFATAVFGFLLLNRPPARIFLGDSGSAFLGFFLGALAVRLPVPISHHHAILIPLFLFAYPQIDALLAIARRRLGGSSPFTGDHDHIHHKLLKIGFTVAQSLLILIGVTTICALTALVISRLEDPIVAISVSAITITTLLGILGLIYYNEFSQARQVSNYSRSIVASHLPLMKAVTLDPSNFRAVVYDLLPYYKELKEHGIFAVQDFIRDLGELLTAMHGADAAFQLWGSYTIVCIESPRRSAPLDKQAIYRNFFSILKRHGIQKNESEKPWGLMIYSDRSRADVFLRQFSSFQKDGARLSLDRAA